MKETNGYYAHISKDGSRYQTVEEHLAGTAGRAGAFAEAFGCRDWGYGVGLLHDAGKFSIPFQKRLLEGGPKTDHATAGAKELLKLKNYFAAYCVAGHHTGLLDGGTTGDGGGEATLMGRSKKQVADYQAFHEKIALPQFGTPPIQLLENGGFTLSFFTRMLFSCLVDADYLDTEAFMAEQAVERGNRDSMEVLEVRLMEHVKSWLCNEDQDTVNGRRTAILKACLEKGKEQQGLYTLTVPTGGGKTIASLAFALKQARAHQLQHIIYVIPYTSIIEQNAQVFREILGKDNVLEDHCNVVCESPEELERWQLAAENWDSPLIVTTNVQFFESLFANKTSRCRKLHNIAKSVIIFDEAQMLPVEYLKPCIRAIGELVYNYHCTAVLCTATQPALESFFPAGLTATELCPDREGQYAFFQRTTYEQKGQLSESELTEALEGCPQALCIVNSRRRAQHLYEEMKDEGIFHLSTLMYPVHRRRVLENVRARLKDDTKTCRLIATSLVEAGVDLDFPTVYRELAGLDSVIQAAGRCNREGRRDPRNCMTVVFTLEEQEKIRIPSSLHQPIRVTEQVTEQFADIASPEAVYDYFRRLHRYKGERTDAKDIVEQFEHGRKSLLFPFATVAEQFHIIENDTKTIFIDTEEEAQKLLERLRNGEVSQQLVRDAGQFCIHVFQKDFDALYGAGLLEEIVPQLGWYALRDRSRYSEEAGLLLNVERGEGLFY